MNRFALALTILSMTALFAVTAERTSAAAFELHFTENCYGYGADVKLRWTGQNPNAQQYLDISRTNNGWAAGTFTSSGALPAMTEAYTATHLTPNMPYLVRINQFADGRWSASETW